MLREKSFVLLIVFFVVQSFLTFAEHQKAYKDLWYPLECNPSLGAYYPNSEIQSKLQLCNPKDNCDYYCEANSAGLLNEEGTTSLEIYKDFIMTTFPVKYQDLAIRHFEFCFSKYGNYMNRNDESCSYEKQFVDCSWALLPKLKC